jgi:flagellin
VQASNGTLTTQDRSTLDTEFQALVTEIDRVSSQTTFNGVNLLDGTTTSLSVQVGTDAGETISLGLADTTSTGLSIGSVSVTSAANASTALSAIDSAIDSVTTARGTLGASQNRLTSAISSILNTRENLSAAESRIRDVDVATETSDLTRNSILQQAAISVLSQANVQPQLALRLLA